MSLIEREVSPRQVAGNQSNAKQSTGAKTPEGKARASLNALTTGKGGTGIADCSLSIADFEEGNRAIAETTMAGGSPNPTGTLDAWPGPVGLFFSFQEQSQGVIENKGKWPGTNPNQSQWASLTTTCLEVGTGNGSWKLENRNWKFESRNSKFETPLGCAHLPGV